MKRILDVTVMIAALVFVPMSARADEGFWTFDNFPAARVRAAYGVLVDKHWLDHVRGAEVRLSNGCSASVVSSAGLVLTANHCISQCAQAFSVPGHDSYDDGFIADEHAQEKRCPGMSAKILISITDVTASIVRATAHLDGEAASRAIAEAIARVEHDGCADDASTSCSVYIFFHGVQYKLYKYHSYEDVRLVFSPGVAMAMFGDAVGTPYFLDAAFLRLYQRGGVARTSDHLSWNSSAPRSGEPVFLMGNPRRSERELTVSQLRTERDFLLPYLLVQSADLIGRLTRFAEESAENKLASRFELYDVKNYYGYNLDLLMTLNDSRFLDAKIAGEATLSAKPGPTYRTQLATITQSEQARRDLSLARDDLDGPTLSGGPASELFDYARTLVRGAIERAKPSTQRIAAYADNKLPGVEHDLLIDTAIYPPLEQVQLEAWLARTQDNLPVDDDTSKLLLSGGDPTDLSTKLSRSRLGDVELRRQLWEGGLPAIKASDDPMIRFVLRIEPAARAMQSRWETTVVDPETHAAANIARLRLGDSDGEIYPEANKSLRLSYGEIDGVDVKGRNTQAMTTIGGLYALAATHDPKTLDPHWVAAKSKLNPDTVLDISTTNDTINGNSGSPLLNARGEVIGDFTGGNRDTMGGDYGYDPVLNRGYSVAAAAITEVITKVYQAPNLSQELARSARPAGSSEEKSFTAGKVN